MSPVIAAIIQRYNDGSTCAEIAAEIGTTGAKVRSLLLRHGVQLRRKGPRHSIRNTDREERLLRQYSEGSSLSELGRAEGLTGERVRQILARTRRYVPRPHHPPKNGVPVIEKRWEPTDDKMLTTLWTHGHSASRIGEMMGVTKNAVIGRAHRLHLPPRSSSFKRQSGGQPR